MRRISLTRRRWLIGRVAMVTVALFGYFVSGGGVVYTLVGLGVLLILFFLGPRLFTWSGEEREEAKGHS